MGMGWMVFLSYRLPLAVLPELRVLVSKTPKNMPLDVVVQRCCRSVYKGQGSHSLRHSCARHWLQSGLNVTRCPRAWVTAAPP